MHRDIGNEVVVAIAAVAVMIFAFAFAVLLSLSSSPDVVGEITPSESEVVENTETPSVIIATETSSSIIFAATDMAAHTLTHVFSQLTVIPGVPNTATVTATEIPPTDTVSPSLTPTVTVTTMPSATLTPFLASSGTVAPIPTRTFTPSATLTATLSSTSTASPVPITAAIADAGRPTSIRTPLATSESIVRGSCVLPHDWAIYTVQPGNTLFSIARAVDSTVSELGRANCLTNANLIITGDVLFVPHLPEEPVKTGVPRILDGVSTSSDMASLGCTDPRVQIIDPHPGQKIKGVFAIGGTASLDDFWYYNIEVRPDSATIYNFYSRHETPVVNEHLGTVDSTIFEPGLHWVRIVVIDQGGGIPEYAVCAVPVIFE